MSSIILKKLLGGLLRSANEPQAISTLDLEEDDILNEVDPEPLIPSPSIPHSTSVSEIPEVSVKTSELTLGDVYSKRSTDRQINPKKLPDGFIEALTDVILQEEDPYTKLIMYSHIICGTKIDVLRERFVINSPRGKLYIASREFVRHRLNKSLENVRQRYYEIHGNGCFVSTMDDVDEPYHAEFFSPTRRAVGTVVESKERSAFTTSMASKGASSNNETEEEPYYQKADVQATSSSSEKRTRLPKKRLLFVLDEEDIEEDDFDGLDFPKDQGSDM